MNRSDPNDAVFDDACDRWFERATDLGQLDAAENGDQATSSAAGHSSTCSCCGQAQEQWNPVLQRLSLADRSLRELGDPVAAEIERRRAIRGPEPWLIGEPTESVETSSRELSHRDSMLGAAVDQSNEPQVHPASSIVARDASRSGFWIPTGVLAIVATLALVAFVFEWGRSVGSRIALGSNALSGALPTNGSSLAPLSEGHPSAAGTNRLVALRLPDECRDPRMPASAITDRTDVAASAHGVTSPGMASHGAAGQAVSAGFVCCTQCHRSQPPAPHDHELLPRPSTDGARIAANCALCHLLPASSVCAHVPRPGGTSNCQACHVSVSRSVTPQFVPRYPVTPPRRSNSSLLACCWPSVGL